MKGHAAQTSAVTMAQKVLGPISQYVLALARCRVARIRSIGPQPVMNSRRQVIAFTNTGMTKGMRKIERTTPRPGNGVFMSSAAPTPMGRMINVVTIEKEKLAQIDPGKEVPRAFPFVKPSM